MSTPAEPKYVCSFCPKHQREVEFILANQTTYICSECVDLCGDIAREKRATAEGGSVLDVRPDILEKYGDTVCTFASHYKHTFVFVGTANDGARVELMFVGNENDAYRFKVSAGDTRTLAEKPVDLYGVIVWVDGKMIYRALTPLRPKEGSSVGRGRP